MITVNAAFGQEEKALGTLGRIGENETRQIVFDCSDILAEYPGYVIPSLADGNSKETYLRSAIYVSENRIAIHDPKGFISDSQARGSRHPAPLCVIC